MPHGLSLAQLESESQNQKYYNILYLWIIFIQYPANDIIHIMKCIEQSSSYMDYIIIFTLLDKKKYYCRPILCV